MTGVPRDELIGSDFSDYFTEPEKAREGYQQVFREGLVRDYPLEIRHRDGRTTPVLYNASVYRDEAGQVHGVFAAARDITDRKRAEAELRRCRTSSTWPTTPSSSATGTVPSDPGTGALSKCTAGLREEALGHISHDLLGTRFPVSLADLEAAWHATDRGREN